MQIFIWDHWNLEWRLADKVQADTYLSPQAGQVVGTIEGGRYNARTAAQPLSDYTGDVVVADYNGEITYENGEVVSLSPSLAILAGIIAVQLGQGLRAGHVGQHEWACR